MSTDKLYEIVNFTSAIVSVPREGQRTYAKFIAVVRVNYARITIKIGED